MDVNPASVFIKWIQDPQDMRAINHWRCLRLSGLFSWIKVARPRECLLEEQSRACHSRPPEEPGAASLRNGMQRCCQGSQGFEALTGGLPGAESICVPKVDQTGGIWPLLEPLRWLQVGQIRVWASLGRCEKPVGRDTLSWSHAGNS